MQNFKIKFEKGKYSSHPNIYYQIPYITQYINNNVIEIDNKVFQAELEYFGYEKGRSALNVLWYDNIENKVYYSSMQLLDESLKNNKINGNKIKGEFCWKKQGTAILLKLINYV